MLFTSRKSSESRKRFVSGLSRLFVLTLLLAVFAALPAWADPAVQITQCGTVITQPGHYILANDLNCGVLPTAPVIGAPNPPSWWHVQVPIAGFPAGPPDPVSGDGIDIVADHVDLLLNGHTISGGSGGLGVSVGVGVPSGNSHVNIVGPGTITGFDAGVEFEQVSFSSVNDVTATNNGADFVIGAGFTTGCALACPSFKDSFQGNTATVSEFGFFVEGVNDSTFRDNNASGVAGGIVFAISAAGNDVRFNTTSGDFIGILLGFFTGNGVTDNSVTHNTSQNNAIDLFDFNVNCDSNTWTHNTFTTANQPCIQ